MLSGMKRVCALALVAVFAAPLGAQEPPPEVQELITRAEQGDADAQAELGSYYFVEGGPRNYAKAAEWYRRAAEQGHAPAQFNLGVMYKKGEGVPRDYAEAAKWYRKAAEQGRVSAQGSLGGNYALEKGVPQDYVQAHKWMNLAASGVSGEKAEIARKFLDAVAEEMTPDQIAEAQRLAREWKRKRGKS